MALTKDEELELLLLEKERRTREKQQPQKKGLLRRTAEGTVNALPIAGGIAGALLGTATAPVTGPAGPIGGAVLGGGAGEAYKQILSRAMGMEAPQTSLEAARNIGIEGGIQGASELAGIGIAKAAKPLLRPIGKSLAKAGQALSGVPASRFEQLAAKPSMLFSKSKETAGKALDKALSNAGIKVEQSAEALFDPQLTRAKDVARAAFEKIQQNVPVTGQEMFEAKQAVSRIMASTPGKDKVTFRELTIFKNTLDDKLAQISPELHKASRQYAEASTGSAFRNLLPRTRAGDVAASRLLYLPGIAGTLGGAAGGKEGALKGGLGTFVAQAPVTAGALTATGSALGAIATSPVGGRAIVYPLINALIKRRLQRDTKSK